MFLNRNRLRKIRNAIITLKLNHNLAPFVLAYLPVTVFSLVFSELMLSQSNHLQF